MKNNNALKRAERKNPLRRVSLACHGWVRDAIATTGTWIWCSKCDDWRRVEEVVE